MKIIGDVLAGGPARGARVGHARTMVVRARVLVCRERGVRALERIWRRTWYVASTQCPATKCAACASSDVWAGFLVAEKIHADWHHRPRTRTRCRRPGGAADVAPRACPAPRGGSGALLPW
eukprot:1272225-Prymnesium_polylepis.1